LIPHHPTPRSGGVGFVVLPLTRNVPAYVARCSSLSWKPRKRQLRKRRGRQCGCQRLACRLRGIVWGMKKSLTVTEFARMGGRARAQKLSAERRREIASQAGKKGGRPRKATLGESPRGSKTGPAMGVSEKEDFYRLLHRAISSPSTSRKSAPKKRAKSGGNKTRQRTAGDIQGKPNGTSR
jgi:hypothetical protein